MNYDYDVLYALVKDIKLVSGKTLEQHLMEHISKDRLDEILNKIPNLTIFVPKLPLESFSAEIWNVDTDIPAVSIKTRATSNVIILSVDEEYYIEPSLIPNFPVVVIKENESIVVDDLTMKTRGVSLDIQNNRHLKFIDENFNNTIPENTKLMDVQLRNITSLEAEKKILKAYQLTKDRSQAWQRDYVYYDIIESGDKGRIDKDHAEHLISIEPIDANVFYNSINDQDNIKWSSKKDKSGRVSASWQNGNYEFLIKVLVLNKTGVSSELEKYFPLSPTDLFEIEYIYDSKKGGYYTGKLKSKRHFLRKPLELFIWNLDEKAHTVKISLEEVDPSSTVKRSNSTSTKFVTNFSSEISTGDKTKIGAKFGGSIEETKNVGYEYTVQQGNDKLGSIEMYFGDNIINGDNTTEFYNGGRGPARLDKYRKYNLGNCYLSIAPIMYEK